MPEHTLEERLKAVQAESVQGSAAAIAKFDDTEETAVPKKKKKKKKKVVKKKVGTGQSSFDLDGAIAKIKATIAATEDPQKKAELARRIVQMRDNAGL